MAQILFFGAATVYGVGGETGGAPDLIKMELHKQAYSSGGPGEEVGHETYNLGIPGGTSSLLLERLKAELLPRNKNNRQLVVLISIGSNDAHNTDAAGTHAVDIAGYKQNLETIFKALKETSAKTIAYGLTPVDESKTAPIVGASSGTAKYFLNQRIKEFENTFMQVAETAGAQTVPIFEQAIQESWGQKYLYTDGLHPNSAGHSWIAEKIKPHLWQLINL